jgi:hypothetical protein
MNYQEAFDLMANFYQGAWDKLFFVISVILVVVTGVGIILPIWEFIRGLRNEKEIKNIRSELKEHAAAISSISAKMDLLGREIKELRIGYYGLKINDLAEYKIYPEMLMYSLLKLGEAAKIGNDKEIHSSISMIDYIFETGKITKRVWENMPNLVDAYDSTFSELKEKYPDITKYLEELVSPIARK